MKHHKASAIKKSNLIEIALLINLYITVYRRIKLLFLAPKEPLVRPKIFFLLALEAT